MGEKQKPSHSSRIQTMSIPELVDGITLARMRLNRRALKHHGRKLKDGPLINAIVAWFLSRPDDEQASIAADGLRRFESMLDGEPSVPPGDGGLIRRPTIGIEGGRVEYVDTKGEHPAPQKRHAPKRRS